MNKDDHFSEEQLNAFVDDELDPEEKSQLYNASIRSDELDHRLCQQRKLKELVKHAYADVPVPKPDKGSPLGRGSLWSTGMVASTLLLLGLAIGVFGERYLNDSGSIQAPSMDVVATTPLEDNFILHVTSGEEKQMYAALKKARDLLDSAEDGQFRQVEIVANERGLDLLRSDVTPFADEIAALYENDVVFYACSKAIERLKEKGVDVHLVPEANQAYTALDRVVERMQDDWQYIKI